MPLYKRGDRKINTMKHTFHIVNCTLQSLALSLLFIFNSCSSSHDETTKVKENAKITSTDTALQRVEKNPPVLQGEYVERYDNGAVQIRGFYMNGKRHGQWTSFFANGKVQSEGFFNAGLRDGQALVYHENGKIYYEGYYKNGKETGKWIFYDLNGNKVTEKDYGK